MGKLAVTCVTVFIVLVASANSFQENALRKIESINRIQNTWKAELNDIALLSMEDFTKLLGVRQSKHGMRRKNIEAADDIPTTFDSRVQWPECDSISSIKDQGSCGSCWAVAAASVASDRLCIGSNFEKKLNLSAQNLMDCCLYCAPQGGCNGGYIERAWEYIQDSGIVTGGDYNSGEGCQPYEETPTGLFRIMNGPICSQKCTNKLYTESYSADKHQAKSAYSVPNDVSQIQTEILKHGPVETGFDVYADFRYYKSGVYTATSPVMVGRHAVRILGWGVENNENYWLVANSWNRTWGDDGRFKIRRGTNECDIENNVVAGLIDS